MWREGSPSALLVGMQIGAATMENTVEFPQKIKNRTALWPRNSSSGYISEETQNTNLKEYMHLYVHCSVIYNSQAMEAAQVPISRWVDKTIMGHLHRAVLLGCKKKKVLPFVTVWMDHDNIMLNEISQPEKDKYHMISFICGI